METYHKIQTLFKRDLDGSLTGQKGRMIEGEWTTPELAYLADNQWEFTEKVDGTNIRVKLDRSPGDNNVKVAFGGRTDNAVIPEPLLKALHDAFEVHPGTTRTHILEWMIFNDLASVTLFGEGYGPKIQGGGKYRDDHSFVLFDVKIGDFWLDRANVDDIASKLGIESVPVIGHGTLYEGIHRVASNGSSYQMLSTWGDFEAEGIVARPAVPMFNRKGERIITKIKAVDFK